MGKILLSLTAGALMLLTSYLHAFVQTGELHALPEARAVGSGKLTWFGMTVYHATLYAPGGKFKPDRPHAIEITYQLEFSREQLAQASLKEIERVAGPQPNGQYLVGQLSSVFRDVARGDRIIGLHYPGQEAVFYSDGVLTGRLKDPSLAAAFFDIWLSERTGQPGLRSRLLGYGQ